MTRKKMIWLVAAAVVLVAAGLLAEVGVGVLLTEAEAAVGPVAEAVAIAPSKPADFLPQSYVFRILRLKDAAGKQRKLNLRQIQTPPRHGRP
jgi:hypothetical protein